MDLKRTARCPSAWGTAGGSDRQLWSRLGGKEREHSGATPAVRLGEAGVRACCGDAVP